MTPQEKQELLLLTKRVIAIENNAVQDRKAVTSQVKELEDLFRVQEKDYNLMAKAVREHENWLELVQEYIDGTRTDKPKKSLFSWFRS